MESAVVTSNEIDNLDEKIRIAVIENGLLDEESLDSLLKEREETLDSTKKELQGICYAVDYLNLKLIIFDTYTEKTIYEHDLPGNPQEYKAEQWEAWGNSITLINNDELKKSNELKYKKQGIYGIVATKDNNYIYNPDLYYQNQLAISNNFIFGAIPKVKGTNLPFDMFMSEDNSILCLSNREEGKVYIFDIKENEFTDEIIVRNKDASRNIINVAIGSKTNKIYISDNISPHLGIYNLEDKNYVKQTLKFGVLGNLQLSANEKKLFLISIKPNPAFRSVSLTTFKELNDYSLKGEFFSNGSSACDLISISPDKKYLYFMTYINEPKPFTPVITAIDLEKDKAKKRFSIKDQTKPIILAFEGENKVGAINKDLYTLLIERKMVSINKLRDIKNELVYGTSSDDDTSFDEDDEMAKIETQALEFERIESEGITKDYSAGIVPKKTKHVILPESADKHIMDVLLGGFWQKTEIDLEEEGEEAMAKLKSLAVKIRKKLEYFDIDIVSETNFYDNHPLESIIQREYVLEMIDEDESLERQELKTSPSNCPNCTSPLLGSWNCEVCGFSLEKPQDAIRKKLATEDQMANLQRGHYFVVDSNEGLAFELDPFKVPIWAIKKEQLNLKTITDVHRLKNRNTLILDKVSSKIIEITPKGNIEWEFTEENKKKRLKNPSSVAVLDNSNLLISDTANHRVLEANLSGETIWEYGDYGNSGLGGDLLNSPNSFVKTYDETYLISDTGNNRVIEFRRVLNEKTNKYEIVKDWEFSDLNYPTYAFKSLEGRYLIIDSGNSRVIEITDYDGNSKVTWQCKTGEIDSDLKIKNIDKVFRLKNNDILISGDRKLIQILPTEENRVEWFSFIEDIASRTHFQTAKEEFKKAKESYGGVSKYIGKVGDKNNENEILDDKKQKKQKKKVIKTKYMSKVSDKKGTEQSDFVDVLEEKNELTPEEIKKLKNEKLAKIAAEKKANEEAYQKKLANLKEKSKERETLESDYEKKSKENKNSLDSYKDSADSYKKEIVKRKTSSIKAPEVTFEEGADLLKLVFILFENFNNQIIFVNRDGRIVWDYKSEKDLGFYNVELTSRKSILITEKERVIEVHPKTKEIIWEYETKARNSTRLSNGNILISEPKNTRVIEIDKNKNIVWEYLENKETPPTNASRLSNGNTLITSIDGHFVKEVGNKNEVVWSFGEVGIKGKDNEHLFEPEYSSRLSNGNTLITDTRNGRILEISSEGDLVWEYSKTGLKKIKFPGLAKRLKNGNTYIIHSNNKQIVEINYNKEIVWNLKWNI